VVEDAPAVGSGSPPCTRQILALYDLLSGL